MELCRAAENPDLGLAKAGLDSGGLLYIITPVQLSRRATTNATQFVDVTDIFEVSKRFILVLFGHFLESNFGVNLHSGHKIILPVTGEVASNLLMKTEVNFLQAIVFLTLLCLANIFIPLHEFLCVFCMTEGLLNISGSCKYRLQN